MDLNESLDLLVQEARELLVEMERALLAMEADGVNSNDINAVFRAAHTIKGSAGLFALEPIVSFTHLMESVLVRVRNDDLALDADLGSLLFRCSDYVSHQIDTLEAGGDLKTLHPAQRVELMHQLQQYLQDSAAPKAATITATTVATNTPPILRSWQIDLRFAPDILAQGMDPLSFIHYLTNLGEILAMETRMDSLPSLCKLEPETCYLEFSLELLSQASREEILAVFDFVKEGSQISVSSETPATLPDLAQAGTELPDLEILAAQAAVAPPQPGAVSNTGRSGGRGQRDSALIKVEARKLDELINSVGELVIRSASCHAHPGVKQDPTLVELMEEVGVLVDQIRDRALNLRMVPIGEVFQRFPRVVRDVCKELNKRIDLQISGADTELDKSMVEKLTDPLLHIVRNAMDHGVESVTERLAAGKPEQGTLTLNAFHQSGTVVIEISDDGRGLNTDKILRKAQERGLVARDAKLSEREIFNLIFAAGFSTADTVTDLSGRGVGMDVVRQNIEQLRGSVDIRSTMGKGTTIQIQLPLTLAIIDGFEVAVGESHFVLPLDMVVECLEFDEQHCNNIFNLRGQPLPYMRLAQQFGIDETQQGRACMVVLQFGDHRAGIVVDRFVGELQAVIKPLGKLLGGMRGFSGSTILGDGSVALLLDVPALINRVVRQASSLDGVRILASLVQ